MPLTDHDMDQMDSDIVDALKTCYDPEIPVDIFELGLIYQIRISPDGSVVIRMTLTSPACPVAGSLVDEVQEKVEAVTNVTKVRVELVWEPAWNPKMMTEAARLELGMF